MSKKLKALALALIMILSLIPYVNASSVMALEIITESDLVITVPELTAGAKAPALNAESVELPAHVSLVEATYDQLVYKTDDPANAEALFEVKSWKTIDPKGVYLIRLELQTEEGYEFDLGEWFVNLTLNGKPTKADRVYRMGDKDSTSLIFYAPIFGDEEKDGVSIKLISNRDDVEDVTYTKYYGSSYTLKDPNSLDGPFGNITQQTFLGWEVNVAGSMSERKTIGDTIDLTGDVVAKAIWEETEETIVTVTFNSNGGSGTMEPAKVKKGTSYTIPICTFTSPEDKEFDGWKVGEETKQAGDTIKVTEDLTLTAQWKDKTTPQPPAEEKVTISFEANGGTEAMENVSVKKGTEYSLPECGFTAPTDKEFKAWEVAGEEKAVGDKITVDADTSVKALWKEKTTPEPPAEEKVTISFDANEGTGTMENVSVNKGDEYSLPECGFTAPTDKEFKAWEVAGEEKAVGDKITVDADTTVKALWKEQTTPPPPAEEKVTISFEANEGTGTMENVSVNKGDEYNLPECGFTAPTDKVFKAWEVAGEEKAVGDKITVDADTTVKALWKEKTPAAEKEYVTLKFVANEGTFADGTKVKIFQNVKAGSKFTIPDGPVRQGYKFLYWQGSKYYPGDEYTVTHKDHTFTAIWEAETITILPGANGSAGSRTLELPLFREASSTPVGRSANQIMSSQTNTATVVTQPSANNNAIAGRAAVAQLPSTGESGMDIIAGSLALILAGLFISIRKNMR